MFCKAGDSKAGTEIHKVLQRVYSHSPVIKLQILMLIQAAHLLIKCFEPLCIPEAESSRYSETANPSTED